MQCIKSCRYRSGASVNINIKYRNGRECETWLLLPDGLVWLFWSLISWDYLNKTKRHPTSSDVWRLKRLVDARWSNEKWAHRKATVTQITTHNLRMHSHWGGRAREQGRTESRGCSEHRLEKTAWSDEAGFLLRQQMVRSEIGVNSLNPWTQPAWCQRSRLVVMMVWVCGECFPDALWAPWYQLVIAWNATPCLSLVVDHRLPFMAKVYHLFRPW